MKIEKLYPGLWQLFAGYFHEDFASYGQTWQEIVQVYVAETSPAARRSAVEEIDQLLEAERSESGLAARLDDLWVAYLPDPLTPRAWLEAIRDRVAATL